jgi:hypothetical protein
MPEPLTSSGATDGAPEPSIEQLERSRRTAHKRAQRKRQIHRLRVAVAEATSERNRARKDRDTLARWILENVDDVAITGKSGQREVVENVNVEIL